MSKHRRSLRGASRSEMAARAAVMEWMEKCFSTLEITNDPDKILKIAETISKLTNAQMKVRQVKGREEDEQTVKVDDAVIKGKPGESVIDDMGNLGEVADDNVKDGGKGS